MGGAAPEGAVALCSGLVGGIWAALMSVTGFCWWQRPSGEARRSPDVSGVDSALTNKRLFVGLQILFMVLVDLLLVLISSCGLNQSRQKAASSVRKDKSVLLHIFFFVAFGSISSSGRLLVVTRVQRGASDAPQTNQAVSNPN